MSTNTMNWQVPSLNCVEDRKYVINFRNAICILNLLLSSYPQDYTICVSNAVSNVMVFHGQVLHDCLPMQKEIICFQSSWGETSTCIERIIWMKWLHRHLLNLFTRTSVLSDNSSLRPNPSLLLKAAINVCAVQCSHIKAFKVLLKSLNWQ